VTEAMMMDPTTRVQTGAQLHDARTRLGMSLSDLARTLRMNGSHAERHLREMEAGTKPLGGLIAAAVGLLLELQEIEEDACRER
jgi:hypothetical protein